MTDRYQTEGSPEGEYQPGSNGLVLANKLGVALPEEMDEIELSLLTSLQDKLLGEVEFDQRLTAADLCHWHRD